MSLKSIDMFATAILQTAVCKVPVLHILAPDRLCDTGQALTVQMLPGSGHTCEVVHRSEGGSSHVKGAHLM